jgi:hypothetical protein
LGPVRISNYKKLWAEDQELSLNLQEPSIGDLLAEIYQQWRGEAQPSRAWNTLQFNLILAGSLLGLNNTTWQREKAAGADSSDLRPIWLPTLDNLRNFLLTAPTEVLSFFQNLRAQ